jgi:hypothetical protein
MSIRAESNNLSVDPLVFSGKISNQLYLLFTWLDLLASEQPKTIADNTPVTTLRLNTTIHKIRGNPEDPDSSTILIEPNSRANFEFIRFPPRADRKTAETIANFTFMRPGDTAPHTISGEIKEDLHKLDLSSDGDSGTKHKIFTLHDVNMSGREPQTIQEQEYRADLLKKLRMIINQLFSENSFDDITNSYQASERVH